MLICFSLIIDDELQLIRLMRQTGPVLDELHITVQNQLWGALLPMLNGHNFVDHILPWVRQYSDVFITRSRKPVANKNLYEALTRTLYKLAASPDFVVRNSKILYWIMLPSLHYSKRDSFLWYI